MDQESKIKQLWKDAKDLASGEDAEYLNEDQRQRLALLLDGYSSYVTADTELKRTMVGLEYERERYLSKLALLEKIGVKNGWSHSLLIQIREIIYRESDVFELADRHEGN